MKKFLTITILVLLSLGMFVSCNADAVGTVFNETTPKGFVDMGVKDANGKTIYWAEYNLGATKPEETGYYYFWGSTTGYTFDTSLGDWCVAGTTTLLKGGFKKENAPYYDGSSYTKYNTSDKKTVLDPEDDAATKANSNWRTPTKDEFIALVKNCVWIWTDNYKGTNTKGYIAYKAKNNEDKAKIYLPAEVWHQKVWDVTSFKDEPATAPTSSYAITDTHIFFPATGRGNGIYLENKQNGCYWSSTLKDNWDNSSSAYYMNNSDASVYPVSYLSRAYGFTIRPVIEK